MPVSQQSKAVQEYRRKALVQQKKQFNNPNYETNTIKNTLPQANQQTQQQLQQHFRRKQKKNLQTQKSEQNFNSMSSKETIDLRDKQTSKTRSKSKKRKPIDKDSQQLALSPVSSDFQILLSKQKQKTHDLNYNSNSLYQSNLKFQQDSYATNPSHNEEKMLLTQMSNLQSIFSPPSQKQPFRRKAKRKTNQKDDLKSSSSKRKNKQIENKENVQALSNGKNEKEQQLKRKISIESGTKLKLNQDVVKQLRDEVNRQIKRSQERRSNSKKGIGGGTQESNARASSNNNKKHIGSLIPYDTRIKLKEKQKKKDEQMQEQIEAQKKEYKLLKQQRMLLQQFKESEESKEQAKWINLVKKQNIYTPKNKRENTESSKFQTNPDIEIELVDKSNKKRGNSAENKKEIIQLKQNIILSQKGSRNDSSESLNHYIMRVSNMESISQQQPLMKTQTSPNKFQQKFKNYLFEIKQYDQKAASPNKQQIPASGFGEQRDQMSKQDIENYVKQKKIREKNLLDMKQAEEDQKLLKIQSQLKNLQNDYQKGVKEFKNKQWLNSLKEQRAKSEKQSKVTSKKKRTNSKKKKQEIGKGSEQQQFQFNSNEKGQATSYFSRASFQSPMQALPNDVLRGGAKTEDFYSNISSSPLRQIETQSNEILLTSNNIPRGSVASASTMENYRNYQKYPSMKMHLASSQELSQFNKKSSVPILLPSQNNFDSMIPQSKKCTLFSNESLKDLQTNSQINGGQLQQQMGHKKSMVDLKRDKIFEEFSKMRKELERNLKEKKFKKEQSNKKKKGKKIKKHQINLPFKVPQQIENNGLNIQQNENSQQNDQNIDSLKRQESLQQQQQIGQETIEEKKQRIYNKLQEVTEKMQSIFKNKQQNQQQQTLMLIGNANTILEEESKENEMTHQTPQTSKPHSTAKPHQPQLIGGEVSQIKLNEDDSEGVIVNKNENTTFLLKKMYSEEEKKEEAISHRNQNEKINAVLVIQKNFRGYVCRRILKEKLRIDKEFKLIRMKYEVKSNSPSSNMSQGLVSSLAFNKSNYNPLKGSSNFSSNNKKKQISNLELKIKRKSLKGKGDFKKIQETIAERQSDKHDTQSIDQKSEDTSLNDQSKERKKYQQQQQLVQQNLSAIGQQTENIFKRQSANQHNAKISNGGQSDTSLKQNCIQPFQSPTILGEGGVEQLSDSQRKEQTESVQQIQHNKVFEYQPKKLFAEEQTNNNNNNSQFSRITPQQQSKEEGVSQLEQTPQIIIEKQQQKPHYIRRDQDNLSQQSRDSLNEDHESPLFKKQGVFTNLIKEDREQSPIVKIKVENAHNNMNKDSSKKYLDSPLQLEDLESNNKRLSNTLPAKAIESKFKVKEKKQKEQAVIQLNKKDLKDSPIVIQQATPESAQQQKLSFDVSSLINYDEERQEELMNHINNNTQKRKNRDHLIIQDSEVNEEIKHEYFQDEKPQTTTKESKKKLSKIEEFANFNFNQGSPISSSQNNTSSFINFSKNSFQQFAQEKVKKAFKAESQIENWIQDLTKALKENIKLKQQQLKEQDLSVRSYNRKKFELERWVEKEKREIKLTQRYFMQGKLKLSQLLENFVKDKEIMKVTMSNMKNDLSGAQNAINLRKSHSFDAEILKQTIEIQNLSSEYNTISGGRRLSSGLQSTLEKGVFKNPLDDLQDQKSTLIKEYQIQSEKVIVEKDLEVEEFKKEESKSVFEYQQEKVDTSQISKIQDKNSKSQESYNQIILKSRPSPIEIFEQDDKEEEEKQNNQEQQNKNNTQNNQIILIVNKSIEDQEKSKRLSIGDEYMNSQVEIEEITDSKILSQHEEFRGLKVCSGGDDQIILSETPLGSGNEIKFPEEVQELEKIEVQEEQKVNSLVDIILNQILLKELRDKLFPKRVITSTIKTNQLNSPQATCKTFDFDISNNKNNDSVENSKKEVNTDNQILVLDTNEDNDLLSSPILSQQSVEQEKEEEKKEKEKGISTGILHVMDYMSEVFERIKTDKQVLGYVLENVSQPLYKDPLMILSHLQNSIPTDPSNPPTQNSKEEKVNPPDEDNIDMMLQDNPMPFQQSVLSVDLYLDIEKDRRGGVSISQMRDSYQDENTQSFLAEMENIHNKAIFDAINEAMDGFRPYGLRGPPLPWSKQNKTLTFKFGKEETVDYLLSKVKYKVLEWSHINAGILGSKNLNLREKDQLELMREERLARILISEAEDNEALWVDYEYEETQAKLDLADIILSELCQETASILNTIQNSQKEDSKEDQNKEVKE